MSHGESWNTSQSDIFVRKNEYSSVALLTVLQKNERNAAHYLRKSQSLN